MGDYTEDVEKRNEELSEALEELCEVNKETIKGFMDFVSYVQKLSSLLNGNLICTKDCIKTEDPTSDHTQYILKESILNKETIQEINTACEGSMRLIQALKDKCRDTYDKLIEMYNE